MCETGRIRAERNGFKMNGSGSIICQKCGWDTFLAKPTVKSSDIWGYEYECARCGNKVTMFVENKE